ncbi:hypothetical protein [Cryptosporangium phraense]|uniref:Contractile injection system tube protein N-terminal domain-containing protein n=1 Tax=Cryptosporangium phraense TaxID=2593070 RepID=A0A545AQ13_9ACTN|nr:hypothetical protein [Cryptosporangium phraense]TQS43383.1 hypothetical protein FL583_19310 [Cryptosporangium phraense]
MERVAFLIDATGERIDCLLNPETVEVTRLAGVRPRSADGLLLVGADLADDPLLFTGGGRTEIVLDLLFDVDFVETPIRPDDVRTLTRRLWALAENSVRERGRVRPPRVRLVWGKSWNVPGVIVAIAERFDAFAVGGAARRSWLRLKLVRVAEPERPAPVGFEQGLRAPGVPTVAPGGAVVAIGDGAAVPGYSGVRLDQAAAQALGSPLRWRELADHNGVADPFAVTPGTALTVPPSPGAPR